MVGGDGRRCSEGIRRVRAVGRRVWGYLDVSRRTATMKMASRILLLSRMLLSLLLQCAWGEDRHQARLSSRLLLLLLAQEGVLARRKLGRGERGRLHVQR